MKLNWFNKELWQTSCHPLVYKYQAIYPVPTQCGIHSRLDSSWDWITLTLCFSDIFQANMLNWFNKELWKTSCHTLLYQAIYPVQHNLAFIPDWILLETGPPSWAPDISIFACLLLHPGCRHDHAVIWEHVCCPFWHAVQCRCSRGVFRTPKICSRLSGRHVSRHVTQILWYCGVTR